MPQGSFLVTVGGKAGCFLLWGTKNKSSLVPSHYQLPVSLQCRVDMEARVLGTLQDTDGSDTVTEPGTMQMPFGGLKQMGNE